MIQEMKNGQTYEFESINERNARLQATAEILYSICKNDSLTIADYEKTKEILDSMVYNRTTIRGQSST